MYSRGDGVGQRVQALRRERGWTARRLAEECARAGMPSLSRGTLAKIESGVRKSVTTGELIALARALGVAVSDLLPTEDLSAPVSTSPGSERTPPPVAPQQEAIERHPDSGGEYAPYFFLSYARAPRLNPNSSVNPDFWVQKLYDDLSDEVLQLI